MEKGNPFATLMRPLSKLGLDDRGKKANLTMQSGMIGSLLHHIASRQNIMFSMYMCARIQANPKESHLIVIKRILRYLVGAPLIDIQYPKESLSSLISYFDANFVSSKIDWKNTSETCQFLGHSQSLNIVKSEIIHCRSKAYCRQKLLFSTTLDEIITSRLWICF